MTELETAVGFVKVFADAVVAAVRSGEWLDERQAFALYCDDLGVAATGERLELAKDVAIVLREHFWQEEGGTAVAEEFGAVSLSTLEYGLGLHGWRRGFLSRELCR